MSLQESERRMISLLLLSFYTSTRRGDRLKLTIGQMRGSLFRRRMRSCLPRRTCAPEWVQVHDGEEDGGCTPQDVLQIPTPG